MQSGRYFKQLKEAKAALMVRFLLLKKALDQYFGVGSTEQPEESQLLVAVVTLLGATIYPLCFVLIISLSVPDAVES